MRCSICGKELKSPYFKNYFGNNPYPVRLSENDRCCDSCNNEFVIPARITNMRYSRDDQIRLANKYDQMSMVELKAYFNMNFA